jgi:hypothetical protein
MLALVVLMFASPMFAAGSPHTARAEIGRKDIPSERLFDIGAEHLLRRPVQENDFAQVFHNNDSIGH